MGSAAESGRHEELMALAIEEAEKGLGRTSPNPLVGSVVVKDGEIVSKGYHRGPGELHAEVAALEKLDAGVAEGSDLYVNLEPCCHHGRTPPCTDAILEAGVGRVFIGIEDPNPQVSGEGIEQLREAGVDVVVGVLHEASYRLNRAYVTFMEKGRPWVGVKWAMSLDGKIATRGGDSKWITGEDAREEVHRLRDLYDAITVGTETLREDNPRLTSRIEGGRDPIRVLLDARLDAPLELGAYQGDAGDPQTWIFAGEHANPEARAVLEERGLDVVSTAVDSEGRIDLPSVLETLAERGIVRLMVEGGGELTGSLFDRKVVDHVHAFASPKIIGGREAVPAVGGDGVQTVGESPRLVDRTVRQMGGDILIEGDVEY
jgi:diaminohydroxyphosphoribosylaminopyrimidine deaminase/5-amino-6-(5-phosphoribosylamino)uracil reductase